MTHFRAYLSALAISLVAACNGSPQPDAAVCGGGPATSSERARNIRDEALRAAGADQAARSQARAEFADACVRRWAYRLAASDANIDDVASAAIHGCRAEISQWAAAATAASAVSLGSAPATDVAMAAKFYAVQARAGGCEVEGDS